MTNGIENEADIVNGAVSKLMEERDGSLGELVNRVNYWNTAKNNPTKNKDDTLEYLYEEVEQLGAFVTVGAEDTDIESLRKVFEAVVSKGFIKKELKGKFDLMVNTIVRRRDEGVISRQSALCFAISPDNKDIIILNIPVREKKN